MWGARPNPLPEVISRKALAGDPDAEAALQDSHPAAQALPNLEARSSGAREEALVGESRQARIQELLRQLKQEEDDCSNLGSDIEEHIHDSETPDVQQCDQQLP